MFTPWLVPLYLKSVLQFLHVHAVGITFQSRFKFTFCGLLQKVFNILRMIFENENFVDIWVHPFCLSYTMFICHGPIWKFYRFLIGAPSSPFSVTSNNIVWGTFTNIVLLVQKWFNSKARAFFNQSIYLSNNEVYRLGEV